MAPLANIIHSPMWQNAMQAFTVLFLVWMAIDTDLNAASSILDQAPVFTVAAMIFVVVFVIDSIGRWIIVWPKPSAWLLCDTVLAVSLAIWAMVPFHPRTKEVKHMLFLMQLVRAGRLVRAMPELMILAKGLMMAARSSAFCWFFLLLVTYSFGVIMTRFCHDTEGACEENFPTVPESMATLLLHGTMLGGVPSLVYDLRGPGVPKHIVFLLFVAISIAIVAMAIGVILETVSIVAGGEKTMLENQWMRGHFQRTLEALDPETNGAVAKSEALQYLNNPEAIRELEAFGVDTMALVNGMDFFFAAEGGEDPSMPLDEFLGFVIRLRKREALTYNDMLLFQAAKLKRVARPPSSESSASTNPTNELLGQAGN